MHVRNHRRGDAEQACGQPTGRWNLIRLCAGLLLLFGRVALAATFTGFAIPTPASQPYAIIVGPDGNLWFTEGNGNRIGKITTSGGITEFAVPTPFSNPSGIVVGGDGNLWFTDTSGNYVGKITPAGAG